jgi:hypothetical protein
MTNDSLDKCVAECISWHDSVIGDLNNAQRVEYERLYTFFNATKYLYKSVLKEAESRSKERKQEQKYTLLVGVPLIVIFSFFQGLNALANHIVFFGMIASFIYITTMEKLDSKAVFRQIQGIERDFSTTNISLSVAYKVIKKEEKYEAIFSSDSSDKGSTKQASDESAVLNFYLRSQVLQQITSHKIDKHLPSCAHGVL